MTFLYSNVDAFRNKKDEFKIRIEEYKPDIIGLTEIWPKNTKSKSEKEMYIPNYDIFINKDYKRGVILYLNKNLKAIECDIFDSVEFEESVWCQFLSKNGEKV